MSSKTSSRRRLLAVLATGAAVAALVAPTTATAAGGDSDAPGAAAPVGGPGARERMGDYDARAVSTTTARGPALMRSAAGATQRLADVVGRDAMIDVDALTGTPRNLGTWQGFLTGPSAAPARTVVMDYVRAHHVALGLTEADLPYVQPAHRLRRRDRHPSPVLDPVRARDPRSSATGCART